MWKIRSSTANAKLSATKKTKANPWIIAGCIYGPCCLFIGVSRILPRPFSHDLDTYLWMAMGTILLMAGLGMLYANQQRLERRLEELERLKSR